jgi:methylenetetrahydrofolate reductase (NADPH)
MVNYFRKAVSRRDFLVTAEIMPPKGANPERMLAIAHLLKDRVHAVNITDGSRAVLRMSPVAASVLLLREGIEPICQMTCRDRNVIALQSDLMGAQALGISNILALTGDPVKAGDHPNARSVFELESVRLLKLIQCMNAGVDANDTPLPDGALKLFPGAAIDPQLKSWSSLQRRFERKLAAGAQFFQSQMVVDFDRFESFMAQIASSTNKPILAGIFLLKSAKNAEFINRYVPGIHIPDAIIQRLANATDPLQEGIAIAAEQIKRAKQCCQGVHLMAIKREDLIPQVLDQAGILPIHHPVQPMRNQLKISA